MRALIAAAAKRKELVCSQAPQAPGRWVSAGFSSCCAGAPGCRIRTDLVLLSTRSRNCGDIVHKCQNPIPEIAGNWSITQLQARLAPTATGAKRIIPVRYNPFAARASASANRAESCEKGRCRLYPGQTKGSISQRTQNSTPRTRRTPPLGHARVTRWPIGAVNRSICSRLV